MKDRPDMVAAPMESSCAECDEKIIKGDLIAVEHGGLWICARCVDDEHGTD